MVDVADRTHIRNGPWQGVLGVRHSVGAARVVTHPAIVFASGLVTLDVAGSGHGEVVGPVPVEVSRHDRPGPPVHAVGAGGQVGPGRGRAPREPAAEHRHPGGAHHGELVAAVAVEVTSGTPGTGPAITLRPSSGGDFEARGEGSVSFVADNHADFKAVGGAIEPDRDGTTGHLRFGLTNNGPAAAYRKDGKPILYADITLPKGVTGRSNAIDEEPDQDTTGECLTYVSETETKKFEPGHHRYLCPEATTPDSRPWRIDQRVQTRGPTATTSF
jgi:hypothetical protein